MVESTPSVRLPLTSPNETLDFEHDEEGFFCPKRNIFGIGLTGIVGDRYSVYNYSHNQGISLYGEQLFRASAEHLEKLGLYVAAVGVYGLAQPQRTLLCNLFLPDKNQTVLTTDFTYDEDKNAETDPIERYLAYTNEWEIKATGEKVHFFVPPSPLFLSKLDFSFETGK